MHRHTADVDSLILEQNVEGYVVTAASTVEVTSPTEAFDNEVRCSLTSSAQS